MTAEFQVGDDLYVKNPQRFIPECTCIVGVVDKVKGDQKNTTYILDANIGKIGGGWSERLEFKGFDLGVRLGTAISGISGRPDHKGYERFVEIAASWGYE